MQKRSKERKDTIAVAILGKLFCYMVSMINAIQFTYYIYVKYFEYIY